MDLRLPYLEEKKTMESIKFTITPARREAIDNLIRTEIKKKFGHIVPVIAALDHRYSNREGNAEKKIAGWGGYERFCLENGHTIYVGLTNPSDPQVSVSEQVDKFAQGKAEKKIKKAEARAARKAAAEAKKAAPKIVKAEPKPKAVKAPKATKTITMKTPSGTSSVEVKA